MNTASTAIKKIIAEYLDSDPSEINDELRLCDLGLDEVDIEELWFSIEDELETTCDKTESNPDSTQPFPESFYPITPDDTVGNLIAFFKKRQ